jgi:hypothetical protein
MNEDNSDLVVSLHREAAQRYWKEEEAARALTEEMQREALNRFQQETARGEQLIERLHREAVEEAHRHPAPPPEEPTVHYTELPEARPDSPLYREWNTYRHEVGQLLAEGNAGRHVLIKDDRIIGVWDTHDEAATAGYQQFRGQPFLVHEIQERERVLRCVMVRLCPSLRSSLRQAS